MNIVFLGSAHFAVPSLKALAESRHVISCVVTQPDRKKGRGLHVVGTAVKEAAAEKGLRIFQPQDINQRESVRTLRSFEPDLMVVIAYGQILSDEVLGIPKAFCVNAHASLLPLYRGAAPINWAIIRGERMTGVTMIRMVRRMDAGPVIVQRETDILETDTAPLLEDRLSRLAAELVIECLEGVERNTFTLTPQEESRSSLAPKLRKKDGFIDWCAGAREIADLVRGCLEWPGAYTFYGGKLLKIRQVQVETSTMAMEDGTACGTVVKAGHDGLWLATGKGIIRIIQVQPEGKRAMSAQEFISGHKISVGTAFLSKK